MGTRCKVVVAPIRRQGDKVIPGSELGSFRKPEFALHALPSLAQQNRLLTTEVGVFRDGALVPKEELKSLVSV